MRQNSNLYTKVYKKIKASIEPQNTAYNNTKVYLRNENQIVKKVHLNFILHLCCNLHIALICGNSKYLQQQKAEDSYRKYDWIY
jgi:hypothetical protein